MRGRTMAVLTVLILCLVGYGTAGAVVLHAQVDLPDAPDAPDLPGSDEPDVPDAPDAPDLPDLPGTEPDQPTEPAGGTSAEPTPTPSPSVTPTPTPTPTITPTPAPTITPPPSQALAVRTLTLSARGHLVLRGRLDGGPARCWRKAPLQIRRADKVIKRLNTGWGGRYRVRLKDRSSRYSVTAPTVSLPNLECARVTSTTTHRHRS